MKKILFILSLSISLFASNNGFVEKIENGFIFVDLKDNEINKEELRKNIFVIKKIGDFKSIVARARYVEENNGLAKYELYAFRDLAQTAMPIPKILPEKGDVILFNNLIKNTILIAANEDIYKQVSETLEDFVYFNTDVFAASLYSESKDMPTRNDFRSLCKTWALGSVIYAGKNNAYLFECTSLDKIAILPIELNYHNKNTSNFYSNMSKNLNEKIDFFEYYNKIFGILE